MAGMQLNGYYPGAIGEVVAAHAAYYAEHWDFGLGFEAKVAQELGAFLAGFEEGHDGFWVAALDGDFAGSISIHGRDAGERGARLRFFITDPKYQGRGIGERLMREAMAFCDRAGFARVYLWTFEGLDAARHLYERHGFRLCREEPGDQWGNTVKEQSFERLR
ncbi:MAG: GNAT family N-acetyltransferase [Kiloniellales bacterium]